MTLIKIVEGLKLCKYKCIESKQNTLMYFVFTILLFDHFDMETTCRTKSSLKSKLMIVLSLRVSKSKIIFLFINQTYVVGTQKNRLNETVILSTQNKC